MRLWPNIKTKGKVTSVTRLSQRLVGLVIVLVLSSTLSIAQESTSVVIAPGDDIQALVNANPPGTTYILQTGIHRLHTITPKDNDTFIGEDSAIISGAKLLTEFEQSGDLWFVRGQTQQGTPTGVCEENAPRCRFGEDLYFDNHPLRHVDNIQAVVPGTFFFDYDADTIYFADDPNGHIVEAAANSDEAFNGSASNVTIENLIIEKYATGGQYAAIRGIDSDSWVVRNNIIRLNHGGGINTGDRMQVINNRIIQNGQIGISGKGVDILVQDNQIAYNNYAGFSYGWEAGATKFVETQNLVVRNNYVHDNIGPGIWTDIDNVNALIENNIVVNNFQMGIFHEISYDAIIRNNVVKFNSPRPSDWLYGAQIMISSSGNTEVYDNQVVLSESGGNGITIVQQDRGTGSLGQYLSLNNHVHDNSIFHLGISGQNGIASDTEVSDDFWTSNIFDENTYYLPFPNYMAWGWLNSRQSWQTLREIGPEINGTLLDSLPTDVMDIPEWQPTTEGPPIVTEAPLPVILPDYALATPDEPSPIIGRVGEADRVTNGLQVLYTFDEGEGNVIHDQSNSAPPLDLTISTPNAVSWGESFLRLQLPSFISSNESATHLIEAIRNSNAFTVEAWINPARRNQYGPARIVTISESAISRNLTLGHGNTDDDTGADFVIRLRTTNTDLNGENANSVGQGRILNGLMQVVYTHDVAGATTLYVNNRIVASTIIPGSLENWDAQFGLALGNEFTGDRPWLGDLHLVAIYDRMLTEEEVAQNFNAGVAEIVEGLPPALVGIVRAESAVNVRAQPNGTIVTSVQPGEEVLILGTNDDNSWTQVQLDTGIEGWIASYLLAIP
ncbi:MAG: right-handed parallel beta-helix repeat-containing protein [Anaerolineae bacterium]|nr:right-handed parallel beta-helix repeat-containing protein [Anaerolineae bacterium]